MENRIALQNNLPAATTGKATLLDMRADSQRFPRLRAVSREQAIYEMSKIVSQAFLYRGQAADQTNIQFISSALYDELMDDQVYGAPNISFAEIHVVVKRAVLGGTEMFGISVASLYKIIMEYVKGEGHNLAKEVKEMRRREDEKLLKQSIIAPMLQAYSGQLIKNNK